MVALDMTRTIVVARLIISDEVTEFVIASAAQIPSTCKVTGFSFSKGVYRISRIFMILAPDELEARLVDYQGTAGSRAYQTSSE